jgi:hypothetical protein
LFEMVLPLPLSCFTYRAIVVSVTAETGIDPNTGSTSGDVSPLVACFDRMGGRFALRRALTN